jgi:hypothetical protein
VWHWKAVTLRDQQLALNIGALGAAHGDFQHGPEVLPDFLPDQPCRLAGCPRVLATVRLCRRWFWPEERAANADNAACYRNQLPLLCS